MRCRHLFLLFTVLMILSCKKEVSNNQPEIIISSPLENQFYQVMDTIPISVLVTDDVSVTSLEIKLVNEFFIGVDQALNFQVNQKEKTINTEYVSQNIDLISGVYYIEFKASDGEDENREYVKINLGEYPLMWEGLLIVSENGQVGEWTPGLAFTNDWLLPFNFSLGAVNNRLNQFIAGDDDSGDLKVFDIDNGNLIWENLWNGSSSGQYFRDIDYQTQEKIVIVSNEQHQIRKFSSNGTAIGTIEVGVNFEVDQVIANDEFIFAELFSMSQSLQEFRTYFGPTNSLQYTDQFNGDILAMEFLSENELLILSNNSQGVGGLTIYDVLGQSFDYYNLFTDSAISMKILEGSKVAVSTESSFYQYDFNTNQLILIESEYSPEKMAYDIVNNQLFVSKENSVRAYNALGWQILDEIVLTNAVKGLFNLYNK